MECYINTTAGELRHTTVSWSIALIVNPMVVAFGIFSNLVFIFVVYRVKSMQTITNIFLFNLSVADTSLLVVSFLPDIRRYIISYNLVSFNSPAGCIATSLLTYLFYYASLWTITLVSVERYLAVCHPLKYTSWKSKRRPLGLVTASWIVSLLFASFAAPSSTRFYCVLSEQDGSVLERIPVCFPSCQWCLVALEWTDVLQFFIALFVNVVLYSLIIKRLTRTLLLVNNDDDNGDDDDVDKDTSRLKKEARIARDSVIRMLIINGIVFFICLFPFTIVNIMYIGIDSKWFYVNKNTRIHFTGTGRVMFLINSSLNPIIYNATNARYRMAFKEAFGFTTNNKQESNGESGSRVTKL